MIVQIIGAISLSFFAITFVQLIVNGDIDKASRELLIASGLFLITAAICFK